MKLSTGLIWNVSVLLVLLLEFNLQMYIPICILILSGAKYLQLC